MIGKVFAEILHAFSGPRVILHFGFSFCQLEWLMVIEVPVARWKIISNLRWISISSEFGDLFFAFLSDRRLRVRGSLPKYGQSTGDGPGWPWRGQDRCRDRPFFDTDVRWRYRSVLLAGGRLRKLAVRVKIWGWSERAPQVGHSKKKKERNHSTGEITPLDLLDHDLNQAQRQGLRIPLHLIFVGKQVRLEWRVRDSKWLWMRDTK